jgi:hypothetical protein
MKYIGTTGDDEQLINSSTHHRPFSMFFWSGVYPPTTFFLGSYHLKCGMFVTEPRVLLILLWLLCLEKLTFTSSSHKADNRCKQKLTGMSEF